MLSQNKRLAIILLSAGLLLLVPLIAMQFSTSVNWTIRDFLVMGTLLFGLGLAIELVWRKVREKNARIVAWAVLIILALLVWAELAVGVFNTPFSGN